MTFRPVFVLLVAALIVLGRPATGQAPPPEQIDAYVALIKAEQAEKAGDPVGALSAYREALILYRAVETKYPEVKPDAVRYRIAHCVNQVARLERTVHASPSASGSAASSPASDEAADKRVKALELERDAAKAERDALKDRVSGLQDELAAATTEVARASRRVAELEKTVGQKEKLEARVAEYKGLQKQLAEERTGLEAKLVQLEQAMEEWRQAAATAEAQRQETRDQLTARLTAMEAERDQLTAKVEQAGAGAAEAEAVRAEKARLEELATRCQAELAGAENELSSLRSRLDEAEKSLAQQRKAEGQAAGRMTEEIAALKETIDLNRSELERVREYKSTIKTLEKKNKALARDLEQALNVEDDTPLKGENARLASQNAVLLEEVQMFRTRLEAAERRIRELERSAVKQP